MVPSFVKQLLVLKISSKDHQSNFGLICGSHQIRALLGKHRLIPRLGMLSWRSEDSKYWLNIRIEMSIFVLKCCFSSVLDVVHAPMSRRVGYLENGTP